MNSVYLTNSEQRQILSKLKEIETNAPRRDKLFSRYGEFFAGGTLLASGILIWRHSSRAFNLFKYGHGRFVTSFTSIVHAVNGTLFYTWNVERPMRDIYRAENPHYYGFNAMLAHQGGLLIALVTSIGFTFATAQRCGIIPVPDNFHRKGNREIAFKYIIDHMKPYRKSLLIWSIGSSAFMYVIGYLSYKQTVTILGRIGRKTVTMREG